MNRFENDTTSYLDEAGQLHIVMPPTSGKLVEQHFEIQTPVRSIKYVRPGIIAVQRALEPSKEKVSIDG